MGTFFGKQLLSHIIFVFLPVFKCATSFKGANISLRESILFPLRVDLFVRVTAPGKQTGSQEMCSFLHHWQKRIKRWIYIYIDP